MNLQEKDRLATEANTLAVNHIEALDVAVAKVNDVVPGKTAEPYCGCTECIVREVLAVTWLHLTTLTAPPAEPPPMPEPYPDLTHPLAAGEIARAGE